MSERTGRRGIDATRCECELPRALVPGGKCSPCPDRRWGISRRKRGNATSGEEREGEATPGQARIGHEEHSPGDGRSGAEGRGAAANKGGGLTEQGLASEAGRHTCRRCREAVRPGGYATRANEALESVLFNGATARWSTHRLGRDGFGVEGGREDPGSLERR